MNDVCIQFRTLEATNAMSLGLASPNVTKLSLIKAPNIVSRLLLTSSRAKAAIKLTEFV